MKTIKNIKDVEKCLKEITELEEGFVICSSPSFSGGVIIPKSSKKIDEFDSLIKALHLLDKARSEIKSNIIELLEPSCDSKKMVYSDLIKNVEIGINTLQPQNMN
jgi:hypothetical protein